jgi:hypothetical protein
MAAFATVLLPMRFMGRSSSTKAFLLSFVPAIAYVSVAYMLGEFSLTPEKK